MNRSRFAIILLFALLFASCHGKRSEKQSAKDYLNYWFDVPLPKGAKCLEYHTNFDRAVENDHVFAVEFQDETQSKAYLSNWRLVEGFSGKGEIFKLLKATISGTQFEKDLMKGEWSMWPEGYYNYEGKTKTGREVYVYLRGGGRRMLVLIPGG